MLEYKIAPSLLSANFADLQSEIQAAERGGADYIHLDIMDGHFVPNLTFGPMVIESIRNITTLPLDCHLMVMNPEFYIPQFAQVGVNHITVQVESTNHLDRILHQIKEYGCSAGVTLNPATPISAIQHVIDWVDMVLVMSVNPGFGGQTMIPYTLEKIRELRKLQPALDIEIDGGVKAENISLAKEAGANIFVAGSAIFAAQDICKACKELKEKVT